MQGLAAAVRQFVVLIVIVFVVFVIGGEGVVFQGERQQFFQGFGPGDFLAFFIDLDEAHGFGIAQLYGPQIAARID